MQTPIHISEVLKDSNFKLQLYQVPFLFYRKTTMALQIIGI